MTRNLSRPNAEAAVERYTEALTRHAAAALETAKEAAAARARGDHIMAATLHEKIFEEMPNLSDMMQYGDLKPINDWLKQHIHSKGRSAGCLDLVREITGTELSVQPLLTHLERRYLSDKR